MVERAIQRAEKQDVTHLTIFRVADSTNLPYPPNTFDAVITVSVTSFPLGKKRAINEYARVTKSDGYIGLKEATRRKTP